MRPRHDVMTLERMAATEAVAKVVGCKRIKKWDKADPKVRRSDGYCIYSWFDLHKTHERIELVREALTTSAAWMPLLRVMISKGPGSTENRPIDMATVLDQARLYIIFGWLSTYAETVLTKVAIAFRPGRTMPDTVRAVHPRMTNLPWATVLDIRNFYGAFTWPRVDRLIDTLPADDTVKELLKTLIRVEIIDRRTGEVILRSMGIPQGLSISPVIANLFMARWDREVAQVLGKLGCKLWRYCDDILVLAPSLATLERATAIIRDRLVLLGLTVKDGMGQPVDLRSDPIVWLGLSWTVDQLDVPESVIEKKAFELQARYDNGLLAREAIVDSLDGLYEHYRRIIDPDRAGEVILSMRGQLELSGIPPTRKEGIERLREVSCER